MEIWLKLIYLTMLVRKTTAPCSHDRSPIGTRQLTCTDITGFARTEQPSSSSSSARIDWFRCERCTLAHFTANTLNFTQTYVGHLNLTDSRIETIQNWAFSKLPILKFLLLKNNRIRRLNNETFNGLRRLLQLDLSGNAIEILGDDVFVHLYNLDVLNLSRNRLSILHPRTFNNLTNLKYLYLNDNELSYINPYLFKFLIGLKILYLERNRIREINYLAFTNLNRLEFLYLNNNSIEYLSEYNFKALSNLADLQLRFNSLSELSASCFNGLKNLKFLYLSGNNISLIENHAFAGLDSLLVLDLINNSLQEFTVDLLNDAPSLTTVWLENNNIGSFSATKPHENLRRLDLQLNELAYFNYKIVYRKLENLDEILIGGNRWRCEFFVPMQDFFEEMNVTLCMDYACNRSDAIYYAESLCRLSYNNSDSSLNFSHALKFNLYFLVILYSLYAFL